MHKTLSNFTLFSLLAASFSAVHSVDLDHFDPKAESGESSSPNSRFTVDGVMWLGYSLNDRRGNGAPDTAGPSSEATGFSVNRVYVNLRGKYTEGPYKGYYYRITPDVAPVSADLGDGCGSDSICSKSNDYIFHLKYAYAGIPLIGDGKALRVQIGQSSIPQAGSPVFNLGGIVQYDYITASDSPQLSIKDAQNGFGLGSSAGRGINLIHQSDYFGFDLMLNNNSHYRKNNAQYIPSLMLSEADKKKIIESIGRGSGDSYALNLDGLLHFRPTGKNKEHNLSLNLPFSLQNWFGADESEHRFLSADLDTADITKTGFTAITGSVRARKRITAGAELDYIFTGSGFGLTVGGGPYMMHNYQRNVYMVTDQTLLKLSDTDETVRNKALAGAVTPYRDHTAYGQYFFIHANYRKAGFVFQYTAADGNSLQGKMLNHDNVPWMVQAMKTDLSDDGILNSSKDLLDLRLSVNQGRGRSEKYAFGISYQVNPRVQIALAQIIVYAWDNNGEPLRTNVLERINGQGTVDGTADGDPNGNLSEQLDSNLETVTSNQVPNGSLNYLIGKRNFERQTLLSAKITF